MPVNTNEIKKTMNEDLQTLDDSLRALLMGRKVSTQENSSHDMPFIQKIMDCIYFMEQGALIESWDQKRKDLFSKQKFSNF